MLYPGIEANLWRSSPPRHELGVDEEAAAPLLGTPSDDDSITDGKSAPRADIPSTEDVSEAGNDGRVCCSSGFAAQFPFAPPLPLPPHPAPAPAAPDHTLEGPILEASARAVTGEELSDQQVIPLR